jgi:YVTN family beta-propeller protein
VRTFLIADVRGYTRFTQEQGDVAAAKLARKFAGVVREEVAAAGGELLELRGDEALAVFQSPRGALRAAVDLQARFERESRDDPATPLRVGIGLDVGEAVSVEGGYRGGALNLAARLCSLAAPGEVLASEGVVHLARKVEGLAYHERRARLKGLSEPVRFVRVVPEGVQDVRRPRWREHAERARAFTGTTSRRGRLFGLAAAGVAGAVVVALILALASGGAGSTALAAGAAGRIHPASGKLLAHVDVHGRPTGIAVTRGAVWVANSTNGTVERIDPGANAVRDSIDVGNSPSGVASGDGAIWVADGESGTVSQINPDVDKVVNTIQVGNGPRGLAVGAHGVWVANGLDGTVSRIDPESGDVTRTIPVPGTPSAVAVGAGSVWVASETAGTVTRIDPTSGAALGTISVGNGPVALAFGSGAVWVANSVDGTVSRIDPSADAVTATVHVGSSPQSLAAAPGVVWVANARSGTLVRLDARSTQVVKTIRVGSSPQAIAAGDRQVWTAAAASAESHRGGTLRVLLPDDNGTLDPAAAFDPDAWALIANVYDSLVAFRRVGGPAGGALVADLATAVPRPTAGGTTYTFHVRRGVRYANGRPLRASDFRSTLERTMAAGVAGGFYSGIVGAQKCLQQPRHCDLSKGVVADDAAGVLTFHLVEPDLDFLYKLALPFAAAVPSGTAFPGPKHPPPGTGPYEIASYRPGHTARLVRNPRFHTWSSDARPDGYPDVIVASSASELDKQIDGVLSGRGDVANLFFVIPSARRLRRLEARYAAQLRIAPGGNVIYLFLNTRRHPFADIRARHAVEYAVDRRKLAAAAGGPELAAPTCQILPPGIPGYRPFCPYTQETESAGIWSAPDTARAARLARSSRTRGTAVTVATLDDLKPFASLVSATLSELGYRPNVRTFSPSATSPGANNAVLIGWFKDFPAASDFISPLFTCGAPVNYSRFCDHAVDAKVRRASAQQASDPAAASALWAQIDRELVRRAVAVPLFTTQTVTLLSKRAGNYQFNPQWGVLLDQLWVR